MLLLIVSILDLSRIEAGKLELENKQFDLRKLLEDVVYMLRTVSDQKGLRLSLTLSEELPTTVLGDPLRLSQILNNLIGNAIKFTSYGSITLDVILKESTPAFVLIQFEVQDTGIGISNENQELIFKAFTQADSSDTRRFSGSGLGLSICKELCELMGGAIEVTSHLGTGSSFRFTARFDKLADGAALTKNNLVQKPKAEPSRAAFAINAAPPGEPAPADPPLPAQVQPRPCALVVEDILLNLMVATGILETLGWNVETAADGLEALDAHARRHFDVIFMDCQMPKMDGFEATAEIRKREAAGMPRTTIIALTATADDSFRQRCLNGGMDEFIAKPFTRREIQIILEHVG